MLSLPVTLRRSSEATVQFYYCNGTTATQMLSQRMDVSINLVLCETRATDFSECSFRFKC